MVYGFALNLISSLSLPDSSSTHTGLPVAPDIAFSWLQVLVNGGMIIVISAGLFTLLRMEKHTSQGHIWPLSMMRLLGLGIVLAFSLPALWHGLAAAWQLIQGQWVIAWQNPRYLAVAMLMPYPALLCLWCVYRRQRLTSTVDTPKRAT